MIKPPVIDAHAHILAEETIESLAKETPKIAPGSRRSTRTTSSLPSPAPVPAVSARRLRPRAALYRHAGLRGRHAGALQHAADLPLQPGRRADDGDLGGSRTTRSRWHVAAHPARFFGIATLPMQAPQAAADELARAMSKLGLKGAHIGSNIQGRNLDDPSLEPVWAVAHQHSALIMVHPTRGRRLRPAQELLSRQPDRVSA